MGFGIWNLGVRNSKFGVWIWGWASRVGNELEGDVSGFRLRVSGFGFRVSNFGLRVSSYGFRVSGFGFPVSGFGVRASNFGGWVAPAESTVNVMDMSVLVIGPGVWYMASSFSSLHEGAV